MRWYRQMQRFADVDPRGFEHVDRQSTLVAFLLAGLVRSTFDAYYGHLPRCVHRLECYYWPSLSEWLVIAPVCVVVGLVGAVVWAFYLTPSDDQLDLMEPPDSGGQS